MDNWSDFFTSDEGVRGEEVSRHAQGHHERPRARVSERVLRVGRRYAASGYVPRGGVSTRAFCTYGMRVTVCTCTLRDLCVARGPKRLLRFGLLGPARVLVLHPCNIICVHFRILIFPHAWMLCVVSCIL